MSSFAYYRKGTPTSHYQRSTADNEAENIKNRIHIIYIYEYILVDLQKSLQAHQKWKH